MLSLKNQKGQSSTPVILNLFQNLGGDEEEGHKIKRDPETSSG
jgi:hypothetical protein